MLLFASFIKIGVADILDIVLVTMLFYSLYRLVKGTAALNIFLGLLVFYILWKIVVLLKMNLLSEIFGQFVSVGVIALIVVFQPEIRKFLLYIGSKNPLKKANILIWRERSKSGEYPQINTIIKACARMSSTLTGALIVITKENLLEEYVQTGEIINAKTSRDLIETIFFKNTPLHDGAMIITKKTIVAARCILPVTQKSTLPTNLGLRHRAAVGITESTDCIAVIVSEQTGEISYCYEGKIYKNVNCDELKQFLAKHFLTQNKE
ncbi:MAG: TIGR00159 family protein [Bacteroidales bacterium]|nr:TIGR00159 family protein [Bacteroidales bacterium]